MRIAKNTKLTLTEAPSARFMLVVDAMDGEITLKKDGRLLLSLSLDTEGCVTARICPEGEEIVLKGEGAFHKEVIVTSSYARFGLYVNGALVDEDFFLTPLDYLGAELEAGSYMHFEAGYEYHSMPESAIVEDVAPSFDGFRPYGNGMALLSPRPALIGERLHVFYFDERREGSVKKGMGANRLCALFTPDGTRVHSAPIALPIDSVEEKKMVDASALTVEGRTYLYYLVDYRSFRALSCAVSDDGFSYIKTGLDVDIPFADNTKLGSVCALTLDGVSALLYTEGGRAYLAESKDLLHFERPRHLAFADGVAHLSALVLPDGILFVGERDGGTVYAFGENASWKPFPSRLSTPRPILYRGELTAFGTQNGTLATEPLELRGGNLYTKQKSAH